MKLINRQIRLKESNFKLPPRILPFCLKNQLKSAKDVKQMSLNNSDSISDMSDKIDYLSSSE
jgi:hypothetical protein